MDAFVCCAFEIASSGRDMVRSRTMLAEGGERVSMAFRLGCLEGERESVCVDRHCKSHISV